MCNDDRKNKELPYNSRRVSIVIIMREKKEIRGWRQNVLILNTEIPTIKCAN